MNILSLKARCLNCNLVNLGLTYAAYQEEIAARPFESEELESEMVAVCSRYQCEKLSHIPPHLPKRLNETTEQHINRLYDAHIPKNNK